VTAAGSRFAVLWNTANGGVIQLLAGHKGRVNDARFSPDGKKLVTASDDGSLRIWQTERGDALVTWESGAGPLTAAAFLPDSRTLVVLSEGGTIFRYDSGNKQLLDTWQTGMRAAKWADFDPARMWLMLITPDGVPAVWDAQSGSRLLTLDALADKALCAAINPVAPHVATRRDGRSHCDLGPVSPRAIAESPRAWSDGECRSLQP
jgi:WD40 repeat protein